MGYLISVALVMAAVVSAQARSFNNPILSDKPYFEPGAIKVNGTYYVVASLQSDIKDGALPIHSSKDLINWKFEGYVFDDSNYPLWARNDTLRSPEIHKVGSNFLIYFSAKSNSSSSMYNIGVATALHPLGPYASIDRPIVAMENQHSYLQSIINDQGNLYLMWSNDSKAIVARQLNENGLNFASQQIITLIKQTLNWEGNYVLSPWHINRDGVHYIFYTGERCGSVGVARSTQPLGPYEKFPDPIIISKDDDSDDLKCPAEISVVMDVDKKGYVVFRNDKVKSANVVALSSLDWDKNDWPYISLV